MRFTEEIGMVAGNVPFSEEMEAIFEVRCCRDFLEENGVFSEYLSIK